MTTITFHFFFHRDQIKKESRIAFQPWQIFHFHEETRTHIQTYPANVDLNDDDEGKKTVDMNENGDENRWYFVKWNIVHTLSKHDWFFFLSSLILYI